MAANLHGCVLAVLVAEGADASELARFQDEFRKSGARVHFLGVNSNPVKTMDGTRFDVDALAEGISPGYYDGIVIPGGHDCCALMRDDEELIALVQAFAEMRRPLGAVGEGVALLADAGLVKDRRVVAIDAVQQSVRDAGGILSDQAVSADRLLITARDSADLGDFCERFAKEVEAYRKRDYVDEIGAESFPGSDAPSNSAI